MQQYVRLTDMLKQILYEKKPLKKVLYNTPLKNSAPAYSLLSTVLNNYDVLEQAAYRIQVQSSSSVSNKLLLIVMMTELINTGCIKGGGALKRLLLKFKALLPQLKNSKISRPYIQIRMLHSQTISQGTQVLPSVYSFSYEEYSKFFDRHSTAYVVQSYSSCIPAYLLMRGTKKWSERNKRPYSVIDACAAPGNKTMQLAEYVGEDQGSYGRVCAVERNRNRFQLLRGTLQKYQVKNTVIKMVDFLQYPVQKGVRFILVDPSCSGSGMLANVGKEGQNLLEMEFEQYCQEKYRKEQNKQYVQQLREIQIKLLLHAVQFNPLRISYSTCSIYRRQNQDVVQEFLSLQTKYKVKECKLQRTVKGFNGLGLRVDPRDRFSDGFYVCIFNRI